MPEWQTPEDAEEKTQECVKQGDNTLFSHVSVGGGGAGIMVLQAGFADLQPLSPAGMFTPEGIWEIFSRYYVS